MAGWPLPSPELAATWDRLRLSQSPELALPVRCPEPAHCLCGLCVMLVLGHILMGCMGLFLLFYFRDSWIDFLVVKAFGMVAPAQPDAWSQILGILGPAIASQGTRVASGGAAALLGTAQAALTNR